MFQYCLNFPNELLLFETSFLLNSDISTRPHYFIKKHFAYRIFSLQEQKKATNPFAAAESAAAPAAAAGGDNTPNILDLFGMPDGGNPAPAAAAPAPAAASNSSSNKTSDDLLQLSGNPFASVLNAAGSSSAAPAAAPANNGFNNAFGGATDNSTGRSIVGAYLFCSPT